MFSLMTKTPEFDLGTYLDHTKALVEKRLDALLPAASERPAVIHEAMRYSVFTGGKRIRPILCIAAWQAGTHATDLYGAIPEHVSAAACAIEVLHTYTLVHDDLPCMDNDDMRRGQLTCHKKFGEANALLAGDALLTLALELTARADQIAGPACGLATMELAHAAGSRGVVGGQVEDLAAVGHSVTRQDVDFIHLNKTAKLFRAATRIGARLAGVDGFQMDAISLYGEHLGIAFQVLDDVLDRLQDQRDGADAEQDKSLNCLDVMGIEEAHAYAAELTQAAIAALETFDPAAQAPLSAIVKRLEKRNI